jgi:hypothetical protein
MTGTDQIVFGGRHGGRMVVVVVVVVVVIVVVVVVEWVAREEGRVEEEVTFSRVKVDVVDLSHDFLGGKDRKCVV